MERIKNRSLQLFGSGRSKAKAKLLMDTVNAAMDLVFVVFCAEHENGAAFTDGPVVCQPNPGSN